ncbi:hypothetical protein [Methylococcus capsulatus]|uniref:hypothetical protein n=1 Tax=Methylococcus capsulatus TaxID=414 RepID=UPI0012B581FE
MPLLGEIFVAGRDRLGSRLCLHARHRIGIAHLRQGFEAPLDLSRLRQAHRTKEAVHLRRAYGFRCRDQTCAGDGREFRGIQRQRASPAFESDDEFLDAGNGGQGRPGIYRALPGFDGSPQHTLHDTDPSCQGRRLISGQRSGRPENPRVGPGIPHPFEIQTGVRLQPTKLGGAHRPELIPVDIAFEHDDDRNRRIRRPTRDGRCSQQQRCHGNRRQPFHRNSRFPERWYPVDLAAGTLAFREIRCDSVRSRTNIASGPTS